MATAVDPSDEDIRRLNRESAKLEAETRKLLAEATRFSARQAKLTAEQAKLSIEAGILPRTMIFQAMIAFAAILGAGAAITKLLFS